MSNYKKSDWCDIVDGLYWRFIEKHRKFYQSNPRLGFQAGMLDKMSSSKKQKLFRLADHFIRENTCQKKLKSAKRAVYPLLGGRNGETTGKECSIAANVAGEANEKQQIH